MLEKSRSSKDKKSRRQANQSSSKKLQRARPKSRWVIKAGSQMVCGGGPLLIRAWMNQVAELKKQNVEVIWVTSGAIASAVERTDYKPSHGLHRSLPEKQALSAIGQPMVMELYNLGLQACGLMGAQVLLTAGDIQDKKRRENLQNSLEKLLEWGTIPILNENDAVSVAEIQFGDNDSLSSLIAEMLQAQKLILLTDVDGLYDQDPKSHPSARIIHELKTISATQLKAVSSQTTSTLGTGGMYSKLLAAQRASRAGIETHLLRGDHPQNLMQILEGKSIGTRVSAKPGVSSPTSKKRGSMRGLMRGSRK